MDLETGAQSEIIDKAAGAVIDSFFKKVRTKGAAIAIDQLFASNPDIDTQNPAAINLKSRFVSVHETAGRFMEYRLLKKRFVEDDLGVYSYLVKYERSFYRFIYTFYNNGSSIKLYKFSFDDMLDSELERSLKFHSE
jgi:hypothetical protein